MKAWINKTISKIMAFALVCQMLVPIIPELSIETLASGEISENTE